MTANMDSSPAPGRSQTCETTGRPDGTNGDAIYAGKVEYRGGMYPGEQASIVEPSVWQEVNAELRNGRRIGTSAIRVAQNALLAGFLTCKDCQWPMVPTYTAKPGDIAIMSADPRGRTDRVLVPRSRSQCA